MSSRPKSCGGWLASTHVWTPGIGRGLHCWRGDNVMGNKVSCFATTYVAPPAARGVRVCSLSKASYKKAVQTVYLDVISHYADERFPDRQARCRTPGLFLRINFYRGFYGGSNRGAFVCACLANPSKRFSVACVPLSYTRFGAKWYRHPTPRSTHPPAYDVELHIVALPFVSLVHAFKGPIYDISVESTASSFTILRRPVEMPKNFQGRPGVRSTVPNCLYFPDNIVDQGAEDPHFRPYILSRPYLPSCVLARRSMCLIERVRRLLTFCNIYLLLAASIFYSKYIKPPLRFPSWYGPVE